MKEENVCFNAMMAPALVRAKHCVGSLKNILPMLKPLRFMLTEEPKSMTKIINFVSTCVVLHDFMIAEKHESNAHVNLTSCM